MAKLENMVKVKYGTFMAKFQKKWYSQSASKKTWLKYVLVPNHILSNDNQYNQRKSKQLYRKYKFTNKLNLAN